ncbi:hypothetical protein OXX79_001235 [Metschnikowia pulcherrima]
MLLRGLSLILVSLFLRPALGGFIKSNAPPNLNYSALALEPFVIYVAIDVENQLMKFLINSQVSHFQNTSTTEPVITDVNAATNRYTTLHVEIDFMGKTFVSENLRFCDLLTVKNTSLYEDTYRFDGLDSASSSTRVSSTPGSYSTGLTNPDIPGHRPFMTNNSRATVNLHARDQEFESLIMSTSLATSNSSIEALFDNKAESLVKCPLYSNDSIAFYYQADVSENFEKFGSYSVRFTVVSNDEDSDVIGGAVGYLTSSVKPDSLEELLFYGVLAICVFSCVVNFLISICSPDQESQNPFLIEASAICNQGLLRQLEASPLVIISYLQYALFMTALDVQYPDFFQYTMSKIDWCVLLGINVFSSWVSLPAPEVDNVYMTYFSGLKAVAQYSTNGYFHFSWPNFIMCLVIWTAIGLLFYQIFIVLKTLASRQNGPSFLRKLFGRNYETKNSILNEADLESSFMYSFSTNMWALLGHILRDFLASFGLPFLVLTIYMLYVAACKSQFHGDPNLLTNAIAFNDTIPYQMLFPPKSPSRQALKAVEVPPPPRFTQDGLKIPVLSVVFGTVLVFAWLAAALSFLYYYISPISVSGRKRQNVTKLYTSVQPIVTWAYLYNAYKPSKVYYAAIEIFACLFSSIVIATLQEFATTQVSLLIVIETFRLGSFITIRPCFLDFSIYSLPVITRMARVLVTVLNIPYLRQLGVSEASRSYVAYVQMIIHCIVAVAYILHLIWCLMITVVAVVKLKRRSQDVDKVSEKVSRNADAVLFSQFEFKQVSMRTPQDTETDGDTQSSRSSLEEGEIDYYRSKSERLLRSMTCPDTNSLTKESDINATEEASIGYQQAELRIRQTDYTTREADRIFQKYFSAEQMDPEMKALWESRDWKQKITPLSVKGDTAKPRNSYFDGLWAKLRPPKEKGFEVVRRRPIVVTTKPPPAQSGAEDSD